MTRSWSEWQADLVELIVDPRHEASAALGLDPRGIAVYRTNYRVGLINVLAGAYPIVKRIVGDDFFTGLAREHLTHEPLSSGNVHHFGARFPEFLAEFEHARQLPYLPDVARVEWAAHRGYYAEDAEPPSLEPPADPQPPRGDPSTTLVRSPWPVVAIWAAHRPGAPGDFYIDLGQGGENALIRRRAGTITVEALSEDEAIRLERQLAEVGESAR